MLILLYEYLLFQNISNTGELNTDQNDKIFTAIWKKNIEKFIKLLGKLGKVYS